MFILKLLKPEGRQEYLYCSRFEVRSYPATDFSFGPVKTIHAYRDENDTDPFYRELREAEDDENTYVLGADAKYKSAFVMNEHGKIIDRIDIYN